MEKQILKGRCVVEGYAEGVAMVTKGTISGWGGTDPITGYILDSSNELCGQCFTGKVLVFRGAKGSSGWSYSFHLAKENKTAPCAMLFLNPNEAQLTLLVDLTARYEERYRQYRTIYPALKPVFAQLR